MRIQPNRRMIVSSLLLAAAFLLAGCQSAYYNAWEKLGYQKRDILVSRVEGARDAQTAAKDQIKTTMEQFKELTNFNGGDLEAEYNKLNDAYESADERAQAVSKKIAAVDSVANAMFDEWQSELDQYSDENLKAQSAQKLQESKDRYRQLLAAMKKSESSMQPVLVLFHDHVLFLKHNLNAAAISSLHDTAGQIDTNVQQLIKDMDTSIDEANSFIDNLKKS